MPRQLSVTNLSLKGCSVPCLFAGRKLRPAEVTGPTQGHRVNCDPAGKVTLNIFQGLGTLEDHDTLNDDRKRE